MQRNTTRVLLAAIDQFATALAYDMSDDGHDDFDLMCDRLRHAYVCEEAEMNNEEPPTFEEYFLATYNTPFVGPAL